MPRGTESMKAQEKQWREDEDARAIAQAEAIKKDKKRMMGAVRGAKRIAPDFERRAAESRKEATVLSRIAKKK